jgi:hypothetical protein
MKKVENIDLEYRMFGMVPYNISEIQKGIQFGHAVVEYGIKYGDTDIYKLWSNKWKTFVILNGGTTNTNFANLGTLNKNYIDLIKLTDADFRISNFFEPDLGNQLTAFVFIIDERVFDRKKYMDFEDFEIMYSSSLNIDKLYEEYLGGPTNVFLRNFLKPFKLA